MAAAPKETPEPPAARDAAYWAAVTPSLSLGEVPQDAINLNVTGRRQVSPIQGFGKMWQKTYSVELHGAEVTPQEVIATWKARFADFWPEGSRFYGPLTGINPGDVALLNLTMPGRLKLSTGVLVLYADEESFTLMTPQGHMFAGWITFSAFERNECTIAQAQVLMRANDPLYEMGLAMGGHKKEDGFWDHTLTTLAAHLRADHAKVNTQVLCVDKRRQWRNARNIRFNAALRSGAYAMGSPVRALAKPFKKA